MKKISKILAVVLAMVMLMMTSITAFADYIPMGVSFEVSVPANAVYEETEYLSGENWTFIPEESGCYTITAYGWYDEETIADPVVEVYDSYGDMITFCDDAYGYMNSELCFYAEEGETYTISFYDYYGNEVSYYAYMEQYCLDTTGDGYCDGCWERLCYHKCHDGGFFWQITNFFNKIFRINQFCDCGAPHWGEDWAWSGQ